MGYGESNNGNKITAQEKKNKLNHCQMRERENDEAGDVALRIINHSLYNIVLIRDKPFICMRQRMPFAIFYTSANFSIFTFDLISCC